jgi:hypothetical protein
MDRKLPLISAVGHKRTFCGAISVSALPPESGHPQRKNNVCFGPKADIS